MATYKWFASFVLAATIIQPLSAETHCPGNVASVPLHLVNRYQMIVAVSLNNSGPYNFLLDTGTEITMIDVSLAGELHLETHGTAVVAGIGSQSAASFSRLDEIAMGSHSAANQKVLVYDLQKLKSADLQIQGILGEDFLEHFDMLIDNGHRFLCLDDSTAMRTAIPGSHIALLARAQAPGEPLGNSLIVSAHLSDGLRPVRLKLDSGTNTPFLYNTSKYMALGLFRGASWHGSGANGRQDAFTALPPQNVKIGSLELSRVPFITLVGGQKDSSNSEFDGLMSTGNFKRVFISHDDHFAVLVPW
ncbi:MAG TPA: retropepsin-like aspartic protease [Terracidiphilus sp.]|jgi:hypothetical protein|nr:retropepsin-like aspartic protease [Terracidiphilus sp.]